MCVGVGAVQDGHGEKVRESLKQVHRVNQPQTCSQALQNRPTPHLGQLLMCEYGGSPRGKYTMIAGTIGVDDAEILLDVVGADSFFSLR